MSGTGEPVTLEDVAAVVADIRQMLADFGTDSQAVAGFRLGWEVGLRRGRAGDPEGTPPPRPRHLRAVE